MPRSDEDFSREVEAHLQHETDRLIADGVSPEEARRAARRAFGNVARVSERFYESRRVLWLDHLRHDVRCAFRSIGRTPIACAVAVASLAAGIAATTATLTVRNAIFYNPPPLYRDPGQLSTVSISRPDRPRDRVSGALFQTWQGDAERAAQLAAAAPSRPVEIRAGDRTEMVGLRAVTPNLFAVLGVQPALGRSFDSGAAADGPPPVVLSDRVWQNVFEQNAGVLGTIISIDQQPLHRRRRHAEAVLVRQNGCAGVDSGAPGIVGQRSGGRRRRPAATRMSALRRSPSGCSGTRAPTWRPNRAR